MERDRSKPHALDETLPTDQVPRVSAPELDETLPSDEHQRVSNPGLDKTVASTDSGANAVTRSSDPSPTAEPVVARGTAIGRYTIVDRLGSGSMGLVLAAFDPTLDRKVALKLLRFDPTGSTSGRQRLLREAQAMAKLQHPNVVTVFEVGTYEDRLFLAMEYVAGSTLSDWIAEQGRTRKEIITAFVAAGHGLAAAHRAGIVHRDFKPTNVLVDREGRVRVADFGLATAPTEAPAPVVSKESDPGPLGMTKTGAVLGTPAYMSPEQHRGAVADQRADQFSFCVALYEALYGTLPFEGGTFLVYQDNVLAGRVIEPPRRADVPARVWRVLQRGLAAAPGDRYPDLDALLTDLARDPSATRRKVALVGGVGIAAAALSVMIARGTLDDDPCAAADQPVATVWTPAKRSALEKSFLASGSPSAAIAFDRVAKLFDDRATALRSARRDACVATSVRHEQSADLLDRRIQCVDQRAAATTALIDVLTEQHDVDVMVKAIDAVLALPPLEPCADRAALLADIPAPPAAIRTQVETLARRLDRADAMADAGMFMKALAELDAILPEVDKLDHAPLRARAHFSAGDVHSQLNQDEKSVAETRIAGEAAAAAHDDKLVARSWISVYGTVGYRLGKQDEARGMEQATAAAVVRAGDTHDLRARLENSRGLIELGRDEYVAAADHFEKAAQEHEKDRGTHAPEIANVLTNAGTALTWAGKYDDARKVLDRALALRLETLGKDHPDVAYCHHAIGVLLDTMGKPEQALEEFRKETEINAKAYPPDNTHIAKGLVSVGLVLGELERHDEAVEHQERALAIFEKHPGDSKHQLSTVLFDLGLSYLNAHRTKEAVATMERALGVAETEHGKDSVEVATICGGLLASNDSAGDHVRAREYGQRALAINEKKFGPDHQAVARVLGDLSANATARGDNKEALQLINRALSIIEQPSNRDLGVRYTMVGIRAEAELALGRLEEALADARTARDGYLATDQALAGADARILVANVLWRGNAQRKREAIAEVKAAQEAAQGPSQVEKDLLARARDWLAQHKL